MEPVDGQIHASDVSFWGIVALVCGAVAVVSANVSALLPPDTLRALHTSRIDNVSVAQLHMEVARLNSESDRLMQQATLISSRLGLADETRGQMAQRIGALETAVPTILESGGHDRVQIDRSINTAAIGQVAPENYDVHGGSVSVHHRPMSVSNGLLKSNQQPRPSALGEREVTYIPDAAKFGIAVGPSVTSANVKSAWEDLSLKMGALIIGLGPLLADESGKNSHRLVVGPLNSMAEAGELCRQMERVSIPCNPVPFLGQAL